MKYSRQAARAALAALALFVASSASAATLAVTVADRNEFIQALKSWVTVGDDLSVTLAPTVVTTTGPTVFDVSLAELQSNTPVPAPPWATNGILPGSLSISYAGFPTDVLVQFQTPFVAKLQGNATFSLSQLEFIGAVDGTTAAAPRIVLNRVLLGGTAGTSLMRTLPGGSIDMTACCVQAATLNFPGGASIARCTFMADASASFVGPSPILHSNIFMVPPALGANPTGSLNFIPGSGTLGASADFALDANEMNLPAPPFQTITTAPRWWPGKLSFAFYPKNTLLTSGSGVTVDFEGDAITSVGFRPQIGADETSQSLPVPRWVSCEILGPTGQTIYNGPGTKVPIVKASTPVAIRIVTEGFINAVTTGPSGPSPVPTPSFSSAFLVVTPEKMTVAPSRLELVQADFTQSGTTSQYETLVTYHASDGASDSGLGPDAFDGLATVGLEIDGNLLNIGAAIAASIDQQFLVDSVPPLIPASSSNIVVTSISDGSPVFCGGWTSDGVNVTGSIPQVLFNPTTGWDFTVSVPLVDAANSQGTTLSGFQSSTLLTNTNADVADVPTDLFGTSRIGTASWVDLSFGSYGPGGLTRTKTITSSGTTQTVFSVSGFPVSTIAGRIDAHFEISDRAGNTSVISIPLRLWHMPDGSTYAVVSGDNADPTDPSFSWNMKLNAESGSAADFLDCGTRPRARILVCQALDPEDISNSGWEAIPGTVWTDLLEQSTVNSSTLIDDGTGGAVRLGDIFNSSLGQTLSVVVQLLDPAGNVQDMGTLATSLDTNLSLDALAGLARPIFAAGPYTIPSHLPEGTLDTFVSAKYFLNRTDRRDNTLLFNIDDDETLFGSGPNVPLTPLKACNQRLEGQYLVSVGIPDTLNVLGISVEFRLYEDGVLVARGNLNRFNDQTSGLPVGADRPMQLYIPSDLYSLAHGGVKNPLTEVFVRTSGSSDFPNSGPDEDHTADFLNAQPTACDAVNNIQFPDRLGDDGTVEKPGETANGVLVKSPRTRAVNYTLEFMATTDQFSSTRSAPDPQTYEYDPTPATLHFTVLPDSTPDSEPPRLKVNESR